MTTQSLLLKTKKPFFEKILGYHGINFIVPEKKSDQYKIPRYREYNYLIDTNNIFSSDPNGDLIDRTKSIEFPFKMHISRPWYYKKNSLTLEECFEQRVREILSANEIVNIFWSGGIDSTAMLTAFLKHVNEKGRINVLYSTFSMKENPNFFISLTKEEKINLVDFSGDVYLEQNLSGIFVTGDGADELTASIDESFFKEVGYKELLKPWEYYFYSKIKDHEFIDCTKEFFQQAGRPITTLLEARWWFYVSCKIHKFSVNLHSIVQPDQPKPIGFYDCYVFEHYMLDNIHLSISGNDYRLYKQFLKDYIYSYHKDDYFRKNKIKTNSQQLVKYQFKKIGLQDRRYIMILGDGSVITTPSLPLLSEKEYRKKYGDSLNYLFNCQ